MGHRDALNRKQWGLAFAVALTALAVAALLLSRYHEGQPLQRMTPDAAVTFVQDEFPGQFPDATKLKHLFTTSCHVLEVGGTRADAVLPMLQGGLTAQESSYILDMAIYSTCPKYTESAR